MSLPWYRWFPGDFAGNVRVRMMTWQARAAYRELLDAAWGLGPIQDPADLLRALGLPGELWEEVRGCWMETPDGWTNDRLEDERGQSETRHKRASKAGAASAQVRISGKPKLSASSTQAQRELSSSSTQAEPKLSSSSTRAGRKLSLIEAQAQLDAAAKLSLSQANQNQNQNPNITVHQQQLSARVARGAAGAAGGGDEGFSQEGLR
jgi:uncharacterized protein YdaU (DUF1376 family)